jgi:4-cresol dehydrogenase (hydroxylating)
MMREIMNRHGFDYITEYVAAFRGVIKLLMIMFDPRDEEERRRAYECSREIILAAASIGFGELKAHVEFMDLVADTYSAQDNGLNKTLQKIKDAVDPVGILAPGKSGIWPGNWQGPKPPVDADRSADLPPAG